MMIGFDLIFSPYSASVVGVKVSDLISAARNEDVEVQMWKRTMTMRRGGAWTALPRATEGNQGKNLVRSCCIRERTLFTRTTNHKVF